MTQSHTALKVGDISRILQISKTMAYKVVNDGNFPVIHLGKAIRIPSEPFYTWMMNSNLSLAKKGG